MKKILSREAVRRIDAATIASGVASIDLMESAAKAFVEAFQKIGSFEKVVVVCGPGNNGGDGLAVARLLIDKGLDVLVFCVKAERCSKDFEINLSRLHERGIDVRQIQTAKELPRLVPADSFGGDNVAIVDALFGTGLNKSLNEPFVDIVQWMNAQPATRIAIDVPSGMRETPQSLGDSVVQADHVVAFQIPRLELLLPRNGFNPYSIRFVDIGLNERAIADEPTDFYLIEEDDVKRLLEPRRLFDHKWAYGHALIVAGSRKTMGAALLATRACMRSGCGLVTLHSVNDGGIALNVSCPEAMFSPDQHREFITSVDWHEKYSAIGMGCGIGREAKTKEALIDLLAKSKTPCVVDADALNLLSEIHGWKDLIPTGSILTPHQKEFDRLVCEPPNDYERMQRQIELAQEINCVIVVKGAYTRVALPSGLCHFNSTGTPALATAGTGDVLTGLVTGLLARGYASEDAALLGVYVHGLAARFAEEKNGIESVIASDVIDCLPLAFKHLFS